MRAAVGLLAKAAVTSYSANVLADTPAAYYKMEEASGTSATDSSGNGLTGTYAASMAGTRTGPFTGKVAPNFESTGSKQLTLGTGSPFTAEAGSSGKITVEILCNPDSLATATMLVTKGSGSNYEWDIQLQSGTTKADVFNAAGSGADTVSWAGTVSTGAWHHIVWTYDKAAALSKLWVDGTLRATLSSLTLTATAGSANCRVGKRQDNAGAVFDGICAHLAIYTSVLSDARIAAHYTAWQGGIP